MVPTRPDGRRKSSFPRNQRAANDVSFAVGKRWAFVALAVAVVAPMGLSGDTAHAATSICLSRAPRTTAEFQQVTDARSDVFGVGDLTTMIDLPDGRRLFVFGDTSYHDVNANGSRGP